MFSPCSDRRELKASFSYTKRSLTASHRRTIASNYASRNWSMAWFWERGSRPRRRRRLILRRKRRKRVFPTGWGLSTTSVDTQGWAWLRLRDNYRLSIKPGVRTHNWPVFDPTQLSWTNRFATVSHALLNQIYCCDATRSKWCCQNSTPENSSGDFTARLNLCNLTTVPPRSP